MESKKGKDATKYPAAGASEEANEVVSTLLGLLKRAEAELRTARRNEEARETIHVSKEVLAARAVFDKIARSLAVRRFPEDTN